MTNQEAADQIAEALENKTAADIDTITGLAFDSMDTNINVELDDVKDRVEEDLGIKFAMVESGTFPRRSCNDWVCGSCMLKDECSR